MSILFGIFILLVFYFPIPTLSTQCATNFLLKFKPSFHHLFLLSIISVIITGLIMQGTNLVIHGNSLIKEVTPFICVLAIRFILFSRFIKHPETGAIGKIAALKIVAIALVPELLVIVAVALIILLAFHW